MRIDHAGRPLWRLDRRRKQNSFARTEDQVDGIDVIRRVVQAKTADKSDPRAWSRRNRAKRIARAFRVSSRLPRLRSGRLPGANDFLEEQNIRGAQLFDDGVDIGHLGEVESEDLELRSLRRSVKDRRDVRLLCRVEPCCQEPELTANVKKGAW